MAAAAYSDLMCTQSNKDDAASHHSRITGTSLEEVDSKLNTPHIMLGDWSQDYLGHPGATSHSRHRRSRSRSGSRSRRGSHGRKRSRSHSRRRSRSRERDRSRRKGRDREREKEKERDKDKDKSKDKADRKGDGGNIKGRLEHLTPAEQAKVRMHMVLQAAAKTDEVLKAKLAKREEEARKKLEEEGTSVEEQVRRIKDIEAIESDSFVPQAFKSSRDDIKTEPAELKLELDRAHSPDVTLPMSIVYNDTDTLAHPSMPSFIRHSQQQFYSPFTINIVAAGDVLRRICDTFVYGQGQGRRAVAQQTDLTAAGEAHGKSCDLMDPRTPEGPILLL
ncbi:Serine/Arginine-related protein 53 [Larimichthys crocea]|uniref:Uncharacterized protein n=1 Tax=Larimichthys crocea TaxID=215358 RepID=A0ACD3QKS0_LARCR|nr:Serine/Arginine-related protein 53 [Larimichthys crocea]